MNEPEIIPPDMPARDVKEEVNYRTHRAGYTTRSGGPVMPKPTMLCGWGERKLNIWPRDENGNLIE